MIVLTTCKNEDDPIKMKAIECSQHFSHCKSLGTFSDAQGQLFAVHSRIWRMLELIQDFKVGLVTCKNEEKKNPIKMKALQHYT